MAKSDELQRQTRRILAELGSPGKPLSARGAGEKLGIGYNQIADMVKGRSPAEKTLIKFASAIGESPTDWLRYGGKHDFAHTLDAQETTETTHEQQLGQQLSRELSEVPKEYQALVLRQIRALIEAAKQE